MSFIIGLLPGLPATPFLVLASVLLLLYRATRGLDDAQPLPALRAAEKSSAEEARADDSKTPAGDALELLQVDRVALEIGYRLIPLVKDKNGTGILDHVAQLRRRYAVKEGIVLPPVRITDNIRMDPGAYRILIGGQEVAKGSIEPGSFLAMDGGGVTGKLQGRATVEPAFGLPAWWIGESQRDEAELLGYTVIDPTSVLVTHLSEILRSSFHELLSRDDVKELVENARKTSPAVVEELIPAKMSYGEIQQVLRNLLREGVPIRNMPAILEALADSVQRTRDPETLSEIVRQRLGRVLCEMYADRGGTVHAVTLEPGIESRLATAVGAASDPEAGLVSPAYLQRLVERIGEALGHAARGGKNVVVLVRSNVRRFLNELVSASLPKVAVLSYNEVVPARSVETAAIVKMEE